MSEETKKKMLLVSAILFKHNVPIEEAKMIGSFIEELQQENKQLKLDYKLYKDNHIYKNYEVETKDNTIKQLKERVAYLERSNNRREDTIIGLRNEQQLDLYKEVIAEVWNFIKKYPGISQSGVMTIKQILNKVDNSDEYN